MIMLTRIKNSVTLAGLAAGLMYMFDPDIGKRRRALVGDQCTHLLNRIAKGLDVILTDMENRLYGAYYKLRGAFFGAQDSSDRVVTDRVRSTLGRHSSHPVSIDVDVQSGRVSLRGPILANEVEAVVAAVKSVNGVSQVNNYLDVHSSAENISGLQGGACRRGEPTEWMQDNWSPTARFIAGLTGGVLMVNCAARRTLPAAFVGAGGCLLLLRALNNQPLLETSEVRSRGPVRRPERNDAEERSETPAGSNTPLSESNPTTNATFGAHQRLPSEASLDEALMESFPGSDPPSFTRP